MIKKEKILEAARALNDSNLSKIKVNLDTKSEDLREFFMVACEAVPLEQEDNLPEITVDIYNALREEEETNSNILGEQLEQTEKGNEMKKNKEKALEVPLKEKKVEVKEPVKKDSTKVVVDFTNLKNKAEEHKNKTVACLITALLFGEPKTFEQILEIVKKERTEKSYSTIGAIRQHIQYLKKKGYVFSETDGKYQIVDYKI
jgi:hypothetical protein